MGAGIIAMVEERLGVTFIRRASDDWNRHLAALESGECAIAPTIVATPERERYAFFTVPYATAPVVIITSRELSDDLVLGDLDGKRVAVVSGYATETYVRDRADGRFEVVAVSNVPEGLRGVSFGQMDAMVENIAVAAYYIDKEGIPNLRVAGKTPYSFDWSIGISRKYPLLHSAVRKALASIPAGDLEAERKLWISLDVETGLAAETVRLLVTVIVSVALLTAGLGVISFFLKRRLREKVASLRTAKQELLEQSELLRLATEATQAGVWDCHPQTQTVYPGPQWYAMLGYAPQERTIPLREFVGYVHPDDRPAVDGFFENYFSTGGQGRYEAEIRLRRADGTWCWVLSKARAVAWDEEGIPSRIIGLDLNIQTLKDAQEKMNQSEARFRAIFENAPYAIVINSLEDGRLLEANRAFFESSGFNMAPAGVSFMDEDEAGKILDRLVKTGSVNNHETEIIRKDGTHGHVTFSSVVFEIEGQKQILSMTVDMTERKRAEEALRESERKLRSIFSAMTDVIFILDSEGRYIEIAPTNAALLYLPSEELLGKKLEEVFPPKEADKFLGVIRKALNQKKPVSLDYELTIDNRQVWFSATISPLSPDRIIWVARDITNRKRAEEMLRLSEEKFSKVFTMAPDIIAITRLEDGQIVDVNIGFEEITGWKRKEVVGLTSTSGIHFWADPAARDQMVDELKAGRDVLHSEIEFRRKDGSVRFGIYSARVISIADESFLIFVMQDITERRQLEAERQKLQDQLLQSQKLEAVGTLAGGVAHDFNNMLSAIIGYAELTMSQMEPEDPFRKNIRRILDAAQRSAGLTRQLLAFARRQTIAPIVFDLNEAVEAILKMLRRLIGENIELAWLPETCACNVKLDPSQFDQILANLCVNSRDAIAGVGRITIETGLVTFDDTYCAIHAGSVPGEYVLLAVSDTGCGMRKETLGHIFEPFFTTKAMGQGTGLGLATVYGIVKQNDGYIDVYSEPGRGTTFKIYLPLHTTEAEATGLEGDEDLPRSRGETVLVVEDDPILLEMGTIMLKRLDYRVLSAGSPGEAIRLAGDTGEDIHLFLTDVVLPEMNGRELADRIRKIRPTIRHLFMSGYTADVIAHQGVLEKGINFIQKPFSLKALAVKLHEVLHG